ncbi:MAG: 30S ribosomal protein S4 [Cytophagales bacterium]
MAKYRGSRGKIARKFGEPLLGCAKVLQKRTTPPGEHGAKRKKQSPYGIQLFDKQKAKIRYGYAEKPFRNLVKSVISQKGASREKLMQSLELGISNIVYRLGIAPTVPAARQLIVHRHITVNGNCLDRPFYILQKGDRIALSKKAQQFEFIKNSLANRTSYPWLVWDEKTQQGSVIDRPALKTIPERINVSSIIEFYAR